MAELQSAPRLTIGSSAELGDRMLSVQQGPPRSHLVSGPAAVQQDLTGRVAELQQSLHQIANETQRLTLQVELQDGQIRLLQAQVRALEGRGWIGLWRRLQEWYRAHFTKEPSDEQ